MVATEQLHGQWWTPEDPDRKVAGVLTLSDTAEPLLEMHDALLNFEAQVEPGTVHGTAGGRKISIVDSLAVSQDTKLRDGEEFSSQRIETTSGAIIGDTHIASADEPAFSEATVEIDLLTVWARQASVKVTLPGENNSDAYTVTVPDVAPVTVQYGDLEVTISTSPSITLGGRFSLSDMTIPMSVRTVFQLSSATLLSASTCLELSRRLADLVSLAMFRPADVRKITLYRGSESAERKRFEWWGIDAVNDAIDLEGSDRKDVNFTLSDVDPATLFSAWHELHQTANYGMLSLTAILRETTTYYENKLFAVCGTIEALHKALHPTPARKFYRARCTELAALPPVNAVAQIIPDIEKWAGDLVDARNHLAHGDEPHTRKLPENKWFALYEPTLALLALVAMTKLGVSEEVQLRALRLGALRHAVSIAENAR